MEYLKMTRTAFIVLFIIGISIPIYSLEPYKKIFDHPLPIPSQIEGSSVHGESIYELNARPGTSSFFKGSRTETYGYNGDYLGPTLRLRRGEKVRMRVKNSVREATTVHWHGMELPAEMDGGPHQVIPAGETWEAVFRVDQQAATLWYHPHLFGNTGRQVYRGLAGMIIIEDDISNKLNLPHTYGVNDIPLVVQDRRFYSDGSFSYRLSGHDVMNGLIGNVHLVNGTIKPSITFEKEIVRLRLLNGSNSSLYRFSFHDETSFHQIASDGGFLEKPVEMKSIILSPGERAEILVDLTSRNAEDSLFLTAETRQGPSDTILKIIVDDTRKSFHTVVREMPDTLTSIRRINESQSVRSRGISLDSMGGMGMGMMGAGGLSINGRKMDMDRIDIKVPAGTTEIWEISNPPMGMMGLPHSLHIHGVQFQVLDINGNPPPPEYSGWKDTVVVWPGEKVRIIIPFREFEGIYMYHCHLLEHEDNGMMGQLEVNRN